MWKCSVCGYEYDEFNGPFDRLKDAWRCPICYAEKAKFEKE